MTMTKFVTRKKYLKLCGIALAFFSATFFAIPIWAVTSDDLVTELGGLETRAQSLQAQIVAAEKNPDTTRATIQPLATEISGIRARTEAIKGFLQSAPSAPAVTAASQVACGSPILLSYKVPATGSAVRYELMRNPDANQLPQWGIISQMSGTPADIKNLPQTDAGLKPETVYRYQLRAVGAGELEAYSNPPTQAVSSKTCPPPAANIVPQIVQPATVSGFTITKHEIMYLEATGKKVADCKINAGADKLCQQTALAVTTPKRGEILSPGAPFSLAGTFSVGMERKGGPGGVAMKVEYPGFSGFHNKVSGVISPDTGEQWVGNRKLAFSDSSGEYIKDRNGYAGPLGGLARGDLPFQASLVAPTAVGEYQISIDFWWALNPAGGYVFMRGVQTITSDEVTATMLVPDLAPSDIPTVTGTTWTDTSVTPAVTYFVPGTSITLAAKPRNLGPGIVTATQSFKVKFQRTTTGASNTVDLVNPRASQPPTNDSQINTATVSGPLAGNATVATAASITDTSSGTAASTATGVVTSYDFRYCVDLPPNAPNAQGLYHGAIEETQPDGHGEDNNCSGVTVVKFKSKPPATVKPKVNLFIAPAGFDCNGKKTAEVPKNTKAKLCWQVE